MRIALRGLVAATAFSLLTLGLAVPASADDFIKECKTGTPVPEADKICTCMSGKLTGADRAGVLKAMTVTNAAMAKGGALDAAAMTPDVVKGIENGMTAQASCM